MAKKKKLQFVLPSMARDEPRNFADPSRFPETAPASLRRNKLTKRQFGEFGGELAMYMAANLSADTVIMLQTLIRLGDMDAIKTFFRLIGMDKSAPQNIISLQQNNNTMHVSGSDRTIDTLVRELDDRDRKKIIDAQPAKALEA